MSEQWGGGVSFTWILEWYHTIKFDIGLASTELKGDSWAFAEVSTPLVFNEICKIYLHQIRFTWMHIKRTQVIFRQV